jgi:hypothetical protein
VKLVFSANYEAPCTKTEVLLRKTYIRSLKVSDDGAILVGKIVLLDFTYRLNYKIIKTTEAGLR